MTYEILQQEEKTFQDAYLVESDGIWCEVELTKDDETYSEIQCYHFPVTTDEALATELEAVDALFNS